MAPPHALPQRPASRNMSPFLDLLGRLRPYRWRVIGAGVALLTAAGSVLAMGQGLRLVVDLGFMAENPVMLDHVLLLMLGVILILAVASAIRFYLVSWLGERVAADLREAVFGHLLRLEPAFFERNGAGEIQSRVTTDTAVLQTIIGSSLSVAIRNAFLLAGTLIMLFVTSPRLGAMVVVGMPAVLAPILLFGRRVRRLSRQSQDRVADVGSYAGEAIRAITTLQAFGHENEDRRRFGQRVETAFATAMARIRQRAWLTGAAMLLAFAAVGVILWQGGHDVLAGRISAGELSAFVFYAVLAAGALGALSEVTGDLFRAAGAAERLQELLSARPRIAPPSRPVHLTEPVQGEVRLESVTFRYPGRPDHAALAELSLVVEAGERLAIVGPSGAGKSTLLSLLLRFHDPDSGCLRLDGVDLRDLDPAALRRHIGLVTQEPVLFSGSVRDNILYGRPDAGEAALRAAADAAFCTEFIERLPGGFDTPLGTEGVQLSGGQRQRIAIARAVLRDPALLLLDEATSSLDAESENRVQEALEKLLRGRTSIVVAHRLATVVAADRIVVMNEGRIGATGRHSELLTRSRLYARLAELQFQTGGADPGGLAGEPRTYLSPGI